MTREQFIAQVEATGGEFRRFLVALCCGNYALADDIAQEAYIKAYLACDSLNDINKFKAWLFKIGYNSFISHRRAQPLSTDYSQLPPTPAAETADSAFDHQDLYAALDTLPPKERSSVLLYYMEGYSVDEIVRISGASESAVKQHLSRGRQHLRKLLKQ